MATTRSLAPRAGASPAASAAAVERYMCSLAAYMYMYVLCYAVGCMGVCGTALLGRDVAAVEPAVSVGEGPG